MKKFNKSIKIEVSIDTIANQLLRMMVENGKHNELVCETIIGNLQENSAGMSQLYSALSGHKNEINFKVGDNVLCTEQVYKHIPCGEGNVESEYYALGACTVLKVDIYQKYSKLQVEFSSFNNKGKMITETKWVSHRNCEFLGN